MDDYDVIVIGGGSAGENAAWYTSVQGMRVALVERSLVGGECTYWACMPSKALLRPGEVLAAARRVPAAAGAVTGGPDVDAALESRDAFASGWDDRHQVDWVASVGVTLVRGTGRLAGPRCVEVDLEGGGHTTLRAERAVVLATGSRAAWPPIGGLAEAGAWDNRAITSAQEVPERLLVLGGGPVGLEMAQAFRRLGAREVTIVERDDRLLSNEEPFAGGQVCAAFVSEGIDVRTGANAERVRRDDHGVVTLTLEGGEQLRGDELLVATGRAPSTGDLGLDTVGLEPGGWVPVDERLRVEGVDGDWLYAVGDVNGRALLTHQGKYQARIAAAVIGGEDATAWADRAALPRVVFTDPQVAAVGLTERAAREAGHDVTVLHQPLSSVAGTGLVGEGTTGAAQLVVDAATRLVLGATFTGPHVGELLHAATVAIVGRVPLDRLWHAVPAFPTLSEVWLRLLEAERGM